MKNAFVTGLILGIFSVTWLILMNDMGHSNRGTHLAPIEYLSILIPLAGVYMGVNSYKTNEKEGSISFFEALFQSFRIIIIGGGFAILFGLCYVNYLDQGNNLLDFSGRLFGGMVIGILICVGVSLVLMNKASKLD